MFDRALYYPHIALADSSWVKAACLFYDALYRIVPDGIEPQDSDDLKPLVEAGRIGRRIDPVPYAAQASERFLRKLGDWNAAALTPEAGAYQDLTRIHSDKTDERVRALFREAGYAEENEWIHVPTELASNFMLYLASQIATMNELALVTGDWGAWTGTTYFNLDGQIDEFVMNLGESPEPGGEAFGLFGLIMSQLVPINIEEIPSSAIAAFREKRRDEIGLFRASIVALRDELQRLDAPEIRIDAIHDRVRDYQAAQAQYQRSADILKAKGWFGVSLMGFSAPVQFGQLLGIPLASTIALGATGLAVGGLFNIANTKEELRRLRSQTPASFITELTRSFKKYTGVRGGGDVNFHAFNCMEEYVND